MLIGMEAFWFERQKIVKAIVQFSVCKRFNFKKGKKKSPIPIIYIERKVLRIVPRIPSPLKRFAPLITTSFIFFSNPPPSLKPLPQFKYLENSPIFGELTKIKIYGWYILFYIVWITYCIYTYNYILHIITHTHDFSNLFCKYVRYMIFKNL